MYRRSFIATIGVVASSFFVLPSAKTYDRVWRSIAGTPMPEGAVFSGYCYFKNIGRNLPISLKSDRGYEIVLKPMESISMKTPDMWMVKSIPPHFRNACLTGELKAG